MANNGTVAVKKKPKSDDTDDPTETLVVAQLSTEIEWARDGSVFSTRSRADKSPKLPGGVYQYGVSPFGSWFLNRTNDFFEFPFKIYPAGDSVIERIVRNWNSNPGNLGVLMNGLRGAGKTLSAQLLANRLIRDLHLPVLVVRNPIPLQVVLDAVRQDMMIIFDEFEKSHDAEAQQALLSTVDGMSRNAWKRLFLFTTNTTQINENFVDRPSRIHYQFEFQRVADEIIEGLIDDSLPADLKHFKSDILAFLQTRAMCTIDIVKAVISEVKTFRESPMEFEDLLNITKGEPPAYTVSILDPETNAIEKVFKDYFKLHSNYTGWMPLLGGNKRQIADFVEKGRQIELASDNFDGLYWINLLEKSEEEGCWLANLGVPFSKTFWADFKGELYDSGDRFYYDVRPQGWSLPFTPGTKDVDSGLADKLQELYETSSSNRTLYGTGQRAIFKIQITANRTPIYRASRYSVTKGIGVEID